MKQLHVPSLHLNGTSKEGLMQPLEAAYMALTLALERLADCAPNMRDYYVQPDSNNFLRAVDEHNDRVRRVESVRNEIGELMRLIDAGGYKRG